MAKNAEQRKRLFEHFSKNLSTVDASFEDKFICPLCLDSDVFVENDAIALEGEKPRLTKAHIWPEDLEKEKRGGQKKGEWTLACDSCNSYISKLENEETARIRTNNGAKLRLRYWHEDESESVEVLVELRDKDGRPEGDLHFQEDKGKPEDISKFVERTKHVLQDPTQKPITVHLKLKKEPFDSKKADLVYLHGAYLHLFHQLGYSFFYSSPAMKIRNQLWNPEGQHYPVLVADCVVELEDMLSSVQNAKTFVVSEPHHLVGFLVVTPKLKAYEDKRKMIFVPVLKSAFLEGALADIEGQPLTIGQIPEFHGDLSETRVNKFFVFRVLNKVLEKYGTRVWFTEPPLSGCS